MAIAVGKYIIRSALNEDLVLMVSGGSKSKGARVTTGALTEEDNRCYWHSAIVGAYNTFMNVNTGGNGYIMVDQVLNGRNITQDAGYIKIRGRNTLVDRSEWLAVLSGNTMTVNGADVNTYYLKLFKNQELYLTIPNNGGDAVLAPIITGPPSTVTATLSSDNFTIEIDRLTFQEAVENTSGTYLFSYNGSSWLFNSETVDLATYGITTNGTIISGDTISIEFKEYIPAPTDRQEFYFEATTYVNRGLATPNTLRHTGDKTFVISARESTISATSTGNVKNPHVNKATFETQITATGRYTFTFNGSRWLYNNAVVNLADYGITFTGGPKKNNAITVVYCAAYQNIINLNWKCSSNAIIYEMRYRTRMYDPDGQIIDGWSSWNGWNRYQATAQLNNKKKYNGTMSGNVPIATPTVNNTDYTKADVQIELRLTSAKNWGAYNKNNIAHGAVVSQIITVHCNPTIEFQTAMYSPDGLALTYQTDYKISGSTVIINSIKTGNNITLVENYTAETSINDEFYGDLYLSCDELYSLPAAGAVLTVNATFAEENTAARSTVTNTVTVEFDSSWGLDLNPTYSVSDRLTVLAGIKKYATTQLFMEKPQLDGTSLWVECDKVFEGYDSTYGDEIVIFEYAPPFGQSPNLMWVAVDEDSQWTNAITSPSGLVINSNFYTWFWMDSAGTPHTAILKYNIDKVMQPSDDITLGANKFITTGREYPVFRYTKSLERALDIDGIVLKSESEQYCTLDDFESMAIANHCIYRRPDGKWFQVAITGIKFSKEELYTKVSISQEAETR